MGPRTEPLKDPLDIISEFAAKVRWMLEDQPCKCTVTDQGLMQCRRCLLLAKNQGG